MSIGKIDSAFRRTITFMEVCLSVNISGALPNGSAATPVSSNYPCQRTGDFHHMIRILPRPHALAGTFRRDSLSTW